MIVCVTACPVDVMKTMQEPLSIIDQHKSKKMKQIKRLQALVTGSDDEEMEGYPRNNSSRPSIL